MKYYPMHMHLHSCHQPGASMESHIYNAKKLGMRYIHFTDHDTRTGRKQNPVTFFDFSRNSLKYDDAKGQSVAWELVGEPLYIFENGVLTLTGNEKSSGITLVTSGKRHTWALLSEVILTFEFDHECDENSRIIFDIKLSQRPPDHKEAHYKYIIGSLSENTSFCICETSLAPSENRIYRLNLSEDIARCPEVGGLDNVFSTLSIILEGNAKISLHRFEIENKYNFDEVIVRQRELADIIGAKYGVKPFVTTEISGAGQHKNCFSSCVPVINYAEHSYKLPEEEAVEHILSNGGIFSYNHPFESDKYKRKEFSREQINEIIEYETERLADNNVFGAALIEVGFPEGRAQFSLADHLRLWDNLSLRGIFITGDGDSDSHFSNRSWFDSNNFATWIAADESIPFPIPEEVFIRSMKEGNCYMGDPVYLRGEVKFTCEDRHMGSLIRTDKEKTSLKVDLKDIKQGSIVKIVLNGEYIFEEIIAQSGNYSKTYEIKLDKEIMFSRIEMYNSDGRCILLTNPIYFVKSDYKCYIPPERAAYEGSLRQRRDTEVISSIYEEEIKLPEWLGKTEGKTILHIGDTEHYHYPFYRKLVSEVKPDIIIHTGDMSDEVKVGRMSERLEEYIYKISFMRDILLSADAELIIVPGNNDIPEEIKKLIPSAKILKVNSVIEIDGEECRVGHQVMKMTFDKKWSFYGHGFTGDTWSCDDNDAGKECRFNACLGAFIVSIKEGKFFKVDFPKTKPPKY